jgi:DHA1 family bicyclomycin/chloramphenicol resistance-like MFS transporter
MIFFIVILMDLLAGMEFDIFVPSFPALQSQFSLTPFLVEALLSVNFVSYCLSLFFVGSFADRYGRKPIILIGLLTFIMGSVFCLWAPSYTLLLIGRLLQGIGIAAPAILSFLIIADTYPLKKQQYYMAMMNGVMNASVAAAPVIGSYITLYFNWQGNFMVL